jgi:hypothetical protein
VELAAGGWSDVTRSPRALRFAASCRESAPSERPFLSHYTTLCSFAPSRGPACARTVAARAMGVLSSQTRFWQPLVAATPGCLKETGLGCSGVPRVSPDRASYGGLQGTAHLTKVGGRRAGERGRCVAPKEHAYIYQHITNYEERQTAWARDARGGSWSQDIVKIPSLRSGQALRCAQDDQIRGAAWFLDALRVTRFGVRDGFSMRSG